MHEDTVESIAFLVKKLLHFGAHLFVHETF